MRNAMRSIAREVDDRLAQEMERQRVIEWIATPDVMDHWLRYLEEEVRHRPVEADYNQGPVQNPFGIEARLQIIERRLEELANGQEEEGHQEGKNEDEVAERVSSFPNLKYAKSKYKSVESILKYVETDKDAGGVKLVIMNFND